MKIALIGALGQLGTSLLSVLTDDVVPLDRDEIDIADADSVDSVLSALQPQAVINVAAYNLVDKAEDEPQVAYAANSLGPRNLARFCGGNDITLVHIGSDYVFSGFEETATGRTLRTTPFRESDCPDPQGAYAVSKLCGEYFVRQFCPRYFLLRTCGLYGRAENVVKGNFVTTMLKLGAEREELRVVDDQRCTPTSTDDLAQWIAGVMRTEQYGLYHATNSGDATWCEFAREIFRIAKLEVTLQPVTSAEFGAQSARPTYSVLNCAKLEAVIGTPLRPWQEAVAAYIQTCQL